jgi:hypothetical protein
VPRRGPPGPSFVSVAPVINTVGLPRACATGALNGPVPIARARAVARARRAQNFPRCQALFSQYLGHYRPICHDGCDASRPLRRIEGGGGLGSTAFVSSTVGGPRGPHAVSRKEWWKE